MKQRSSGCTCGRRLAGWGAILVRLIDDARALGYKTIRLDSAPFMHEAHALYRSYGFVSSSPHEGWEFESVPALLDVPVVFMSLDLGPG
jgi:hypothetical protein